MANLFAIVAGSQSMGRIFYNGDSFIGSQLTNRTHVRCGTGEVHGNN